MKQNKIKENRMKEVIKIEELTKLKVPILKRLTKLTDLWWDQPGKKKKEQITNIRNTKENITTGAAYMNT